MIKPASALCNMRCKYCFYHDVTDHRDVKSFGLMSEETAENLIKKALEFADGESIAFAFQGGEPTIRGLDFFRFFVKKVAELNTKKSTIYYGLQTNGTLIDSNWANFFNRHNFLIGLSLDGDFNNNSFRIDEKVATHIIKSPRLPRYLKSTRLTLTYLPYLQADVLITLMIY